MLVCAAVTVRTSFNQLINTKWRTSPMPHTVTDPVTTGSNSSESLHNVSASSSNGVLLVGALVGMAITGVQYAQWLNTPLGRKWDQQHTWFVTVVGVMLTLAWLAVHDLKAAIKAFCFFMVSGMPIVIRALSLDSARLETLISRERSQSDH
jgi:hypothetical protein